MKGKDIQPLHGCSMLTKSESEVRKATEDTEPMAVCSGS